MPFFWLPFGNSIGWSTQDIIEGFAGKSKYAAPGGWNDADFLMTGALTMTYLQSRTEFSFWSLMNSPLIVTTDIRDMSNKGTILLNTEVIAVNQDPLGISGDRISKLSNGGQIWSKKLLKGDQVVILYNANWFSGIELTLNWSDIGISSSTRLNIRDLWQKKDLGVFTQKFTSKIDPHDVVMIRLSVATNNMK